MLQVMKLSMMMARLVEDDESFARIVHLCMGSMKGSAKGVGDQGIARSGAVEAEFASRSLRRSQA